MTFLSDTALKHELNARGFRSTPQRQKVLRIFMALTQGEHLSAENLHQALEEDGEHISLSTVYRTLHLMVYMGLLRELELAEGHKHYELNRPMLDHHHLVCVHCNQTLEFSESSISEIGKKTAETSGYQVLDCQLTLYGICSKCYMPEART
ncbi:MAG: Fe-responsive transcriptional regulator Fur [Phormidesmis priestleyi Ana]|uniref:Fe-responsive transcriptional regulator Fur n=1 Tax=Phormidesmis priestleyi Ana TaxID=1666911 RepID=A0A0P7ZV45_9CYAN|nr:MAG: Fe-responsive transcriptional regulator Fur [Phormidesmis priestleyi Ana]